MPNGKGSLECCYCIHYRGEWQGYDAAYEQGFCEYHKSALPSTTINWEHRICSNFSPNEYYFRDNPIFELHDMSKRITVEERFSWFDTTLQPNVLYTFHYNNPRNVKEILKFNEEST
jgi:hypothetical protein